MKNILRLCNKFPILFALRILLIYVAKWLTFKDSYISFSQSGEDHIIANLVDTNNNGFYIDAGCNDPIKLSNTLNLYIRGWKGINIDINDELINKFKKIRIKDISICAAISDKVEEKEYYEFDSNTVNTIQEEVVEDWKVKWKFKSKRKVQAVTLTQILDLYLPIGQDIDLLTVDVEGYDFKVLKGLDFFKYKPKMIIVEIHTIDLEQLRNNEIYNYLFERNYRLIGYISMNAYFRLLS
jgi:FkbM family methyltransferase